MHSARPTARFDPSGQRVAVIGADSSAGTLIDWMAGAGAGIEVFPLAPRRVVPRLRRTVRVVQRRRIKVVTSPIEEVTAVGVRTADGVHHDADAIVYGSGFAVRAGLPPDTLLGSRGLSIQQAWTDGGEPYRGVALHGFPNYFTVSGSDSAAAVRYIVECLRLMGDHTRIEVRRSSQQVFNERVHLHTPSAPLDASAFDLSSPLDEAGESYDGAATLALAGTSRDVRVRLAGHLDPIDGQYHWQGTVLDRLPEELTKQGRSITLAVGERCAVARITEETAQGTYSIAGVGSPPFPTADIASFSLG